MKIASAILVICAGAAAASIDHCVQDTFPQYNVGGTAYQVKELWLLPFKESWSIRIPSFEICSNSKPTAVSVTVCDEDAGHEPSIFIFNLQTATIRRNAYPIKNDAVVYVTVFCESNNTVKIPQDGKNYEPVKSPVIGRQSAPNKRPLFRKGHILNKRYLYDTSYKPFKGFPGGTDHKPLKSSLDRTQYQLGESSLDGTDHIPNKSYLDGTLYEPLISLPAKSNLNISPYKPYEGSLIGNLPFYLDDPNGLVSSLAELPNIGYLDGVLPKQLNSLVPTRLAPATNKNNLDGTPYIPFNDSKVDLINNAYLEGKGFPSVGGKLDLLNKIPYELFNSLDGVPNKSYLDGPPNDPFDGSFNSLPAKNYLNNWWWTPYKPGGSFVENIQFHLNGPIPYDSKFDSLVGLPSTIDMDEKYYKPSEGPLVEAYRNSDKEIGIDKFYKPVNGFENKPVKLLLTTGKEGISEDYLYGYKPSTSSN